MGSAEGWASLPACTAPVVHVCVHADNSGVFRDIKRVRERTLLEAPAPGLRKLRVAQVCAMHTLTAHVRRCMHEGTRKHCARGNRRPAYIYPRHLLARSLFIRCLHL